MYIFTVQRFTKKVKQYKLHNEVRELIAALEKAEGIPMVRALFEPFPPYWKRKEGKLRLIATIRRVGDDQVLCLLDILKREEANYKQFVREPRQFRKEHLALDEDELQRWLSKQKKLLKDKAQCQIRQVRPLPDDLRPWLEPPGWGMDDVVIYESEEWVERFRRRQIRDHWKTYYSIISDIIGGSGSTQVLTLRPGLKLRCKEHRCVLFSDIGTADAPARQVLFLLAPFDRQPLDAEIDEVVRASQPLGGLLMAAANRLPMVDDLAPFASRAYPYYLLADEDSWLKIEREEEANLALSAEEERVLRSVSRPAPGDSALPVFINGRAGSGKSTMLFYLFADYCYRKWRHNLPRDPLFLTYNEELLKVAKDEVRKLLSSHHRFLAERTREDEIPPTDAFFKPFQRFLIDLLPTDERKRFNPDDPKKKYISFYRFKRLYMGEPFRKSLPRGQSERERKEREELQDERRLALPPGHARKWSPELCWHVIRTFIKGYRLDGFMDPDDYQEVPRRERTVSEETFREIYESIWKEWYMPITTEQGYWDDQDLIRKVLELKCYHPEYTAVFCDEAQDFTRLELQLIMRLSVLSQYDLGYQPVRSLPFAFAGDPFQTLNPTGFRWSSVQAAFYDEVLTALDPVGQLNLKMNFQELAYNYRSTPPIVRVTNLIQLWRHVLFDLPELQPQMWWKKGEFPEPQKFILDRNISLDELKRRVVHTILILPCEKGQEVAYIQQDGVLSQIFPKVKDPPKNVLSAIEAKGLEFKRVILYKFGEACDQAVWKLISGPRDHPVEFQYFFNKLYVAASRAMERLFVVDSEEGDRQLWERADGPEDLESFLAKVENRGAWEERVQTIGMGYSDNAREMEEEDLLSIAQEFERKGLSLKNPDYLRRAAKYYRVLGYDVEADLCEAWALRFEEKFREAGRLFRKHGKVNEAEECFWEGMCWDEFV